MGLGWLKPSSGRFACTFKGDLAEKYSIIDELGKGSQGITYLVKSRATGIEYVAKESRDMTEDGQVKFMQEFKLMRDLTHPNCMQVTEVLGGKCCIDGAWQDQLFLIAEYARGQDLHQFMQKKRLHRKLPTEEWAAGVVHQVFSGLSFIHSLGIVHNDLKPDNILMMDEFLPADPDRVPHVVICDFGCATRESDRFFKCGDPRYQSPETWVTMRKLMDDEEDDYNKVGSKADVWSLGVTLYELLSGFLPFLYRPCSVADLVEDPEEMQRLGVAIIENEVDLSFCDGASEDAKALLSGLLTKCPDKRLSAAEVLDSRNPLSRWLFTKRKSRVRRAASLPIPARGIEDEILLDPTKLDVCPDVLLQTCGRLESKNVRRASLPNVDFYKARLRSDPRKLDGEFWEIDPNDNGRLNFKEFVASAVLSSRMAIRSLSFHGLDRSTTSLSVSGEDSPTSDEESMLFVNSMARRATCLCLTMAGIGKLL
mmetsp:Transcript_15934/g.34882  ORF Transcript_15934/g.34882 Transcript_15934/m.34882 type:complete len:482 (+) Transcript_15934:39-1484(+)|eukprot:CAMPEP_0170610230 /NCGR_PEP_ID=MMETSP0224-20130122/22543_1 /TAXON_ID=285029 /ORGANISM="Togula jolla, Strain CCCM 725" /LENGTH=481 /DNA_ID=CAMNT_0010935581 /DNA_START=35 /DNA_END=1480 /DNA_ORIENTATION=+